MKNNTLCTIDAEKLHDLASLRCEQEQWGVALELINMAIELNPEEMKFYFLRAKIHFYRQQWDSAIVDCNQILIKNPLHVSTHLVLADIYFVAGEKMRAILQYLYSCYLQPTSMICHFKLGNALLSTSELNGALDAFQKALALENKPEIWINLSAVYLAMWLNDKADECLDEALKLNARSGYGHLNRAVVLTRKELFLEAEEAYQKALQYQPELGVMIYSNRCTNQSNQNDIVGAIESANKALELDPQCHLARFNRALFYLKLGKFREGWDDYECRFLLDQTGCQLLQTSQPLWQGQDLTNRRLLVHTEQGVGDTFQFIRYLLLLKQSGATLIFLGPKDLIPFLKTQSWLPVSEWVTNGEVLPEFDYFVPLLSLPHRFGTEINSIPPIGEWQVTPAAAPRLPKKKRGKRLRVGLVWAGDPVHKNDHNRSIALSNFASLLRCKGIDFYSLQYGPRSQDIQALGWEDRICNLAPEIKSWEDTAQLLMELDLLITVDTAVAHLSASLNKSTWMLLPFCPDFRWLLEGADSPWYPSMCLFRQEQVHDWSAPLKALEDQIKFYRRG